METAGLITIKNRRLLLAFSKNKQAYYLPGGKLDKGETSIDGLIREINEELNITINPHALQFYTHIQAPAFGEQYGTVMEQDCFILDLQEIPNPGAEIEYFRYFDSRTYCLEPKQVPGVLLLMTKLRVDNLID